MTDVPLFLMSALNRLRHLSEWPGWARSGRLAPRDRMSANHPKRPSRAGWYGLQRNRPDRLHQLSPSAGVSPHDRVADVRSYHLTAGPAKRFKWLSSGSSFPAQAATPGFAESCGVSAIPMRAPVHKPVRWDTGHVMREHNVAACSIAHPGGVPSGPSCSSGMVISANSDSLAVRSWPRSRTTPWSGGSAAAMARRTNVPPALPATTSDTLRLALQSP